MQLNNGIFVAFSTAFNIDDKKYNFELNSGKKQLTSINIIYTINNILNNAAIIPNIRCNKYFNGFAVSLELYSIT